MPFTALIFKGTHPHLGLPPLPFEPARAPLFFTDLSSPANPDLGYARLVVICYPRKLMTHEAAKRCAKNPQGEELMETKAARLVMGTERNFWEFYTRKTASNAIRLALKQESRCVPDIRGLLDNHR